MEIIEVLVEGGNASPGPPLGPKLGPLGVNIKAIVDGINEATKDFEGMQVPVTLEVDPDSGDFDVEVGTPPTAALVIQQAGVERGSGEPQEDFVGDISVDDAKKIAEMKKNDMLGKTVKARVREVVGTCVSMGVTFEGTDPREAIGVLESGEYDSAIAE